MHRPICGGISKTSSQCCRGIIFSLTFAFFFFFNAFPAIAGRAGTVSGTQGGLLTFQASGTSSNLVFSSVILRGDLLISNVNLVTIPPENRCITIVIILKSAIQSFILSNAFRVTKIEETEYSFRCTQNMRNFYYIIEYYIFCIAYILCVYVKNNTCFIMYYIVIILHYVTLYSIMLHYVISFTLYICKKDINVWTRLTFLLCLPLKINVSNFNSEFMYLFNICMCYIRSTVDIHIFTSILYIFYIAYCIKLCYFLYYNRY